MFLISSTDLLPILGINAELFSRWRRNGWIVPIDPSTGKRGGPALYSLMQAWGLCCAASLHHSSGSSYRFMEDMARKGNIPRRYDAAKERKTLELLLKHGPFESPADADLRIVENESWSKLAPILERLRQHCLKMWAEEPPAERSASSGEARHGRRQAASPGA
jgi:hypothetical protein